MKVVDWSLSNRHDWVKGKFLGFPASYASAIGHILCGIPRDHSSRVSTSWKTHLDFFLAPVGCLWRFDEFSISFQSTWVGMVLVVHWTDISTATYHRIGHHHFGICHGIWHNGVVRHTTSVRVGNAEIDNDRTISVHKKSSNPGRVSLGDWSKRAMDFLVHAHLDRPLWAGWSLDDPYWRGAFAYGAWQRVQVLLRANPQIFDSCPKVRKEFEIAFGGRNGQENNLQPNGNWDRDYMNGSQKRDSPLW